MRCRKCGKVVKSWYAESWKLEYMCPECYDKKRFSKEDIIKINQLFEPILKKWGPNDLYYHIYTLKEMGIIN